MRYYRGKLTHARVAEWAIIGVVVGVGELRAGYPLWLAELVALTALLISYVIYRSWYWEICPDRLIHRRYFSRVVWLFTEISYVGPMTGVVAAYPVGRNWLEISNVSGKKMIIQPANCEEFLLEMRKYLPRITLNR